MSLRSLRRPIVWLPLLALVAVLVALVTVPFPGRDIPNSTPQSADTVSVELNKGGLPIGQPWVKTTNYQDHNGNYSGAYYTQVFAGTKPDYPIEIPTMMTQGVATNAQLCDITGMIGNYAEVQPTDAAVNCKPQIDAVAKGDATACYNDWASNYSLLKAAIDANLKYNTAGLPQHTLEVNTSKLHHELDFNLNGYNVANACGYNMSLDDSRGVKPVVPTTNA